MHTPKLDALLIQVNSVELERTGPWANSGTMCLSASRALGLRERYGLGETTAYTGRRIQAAAGTLSRTRATFARGASSSAWPAVASRCSEGTLSLVQLDGLCGGSVVRAGQAPR